MMSGAPIIPAETAVDLSGILGRQQIVRHRDRWQKDDQEQRQGDELRAAIAGATRRKTHPERSHRKSQQDPREIEEKLHSQCRFYNSDSGAKTRLHLGGRSGSNRRIVKVEKQPARAKPLAHARYQSDRLTSYRYARMMNKLALRAHSPGHGGFLD